MDSCVTAAIARREYRLFALHLAYGQRTEMKENQAFHALADHFGVEGKLQARLEHLAEIGGSSLTDGSLTIGEANLSSREVPNTYVPFRNTQFLSIAASWAEVLGAEKIFIGAVWEDSSGYPDCRPEYYDAMNAVMRAGARPETNITIETPLIKLSKREIVQRGVELGAPFHLTWSCYRDAEIACGNCDSCALRLRAFAEAGVEDPIPYARRPEYARV
jgi:7-cyano-7-deazaguanine synthase